VAALLLRGGRVVGKETRLLDRADTLDDAGLVQQFLTQHYLGGAAPPSRLVTATAPAEAEVTLQALAARAGRHVELLVPQRGRLRRLVLSAERNAAHALEDLAARVAGRRARFSPETLELQKALGLAEPPWRMVCFDVSNLGTEGAVAAVVAAENGRARTGLYRRMRVRRPGPDDFAMIGEAVERYWTRVESGEEPRPDLVVVDGGAGQVGAARRALERVATRPVPLIGLAKREETVVREQGGPLVLPRRSPALRALQRLRDEAHRFGIAYHRKLRGRARIASALDQVAGVGPARRAALLRAFGSVAALSGAEPAEIASRAGVPLVLARRVAAHLGGAPGATAGGSGGAPARRSAGDDSPRRSA
jgi:excinuclease ABC subunit C